MAWTGRSTLQPARRPALPVLAVTGDLQPGGYSIFDSGLYRIHGLKWIFPQEKATFDALVMFTSEAKML
jgi:hypothetical protein